MKSIIVYFIIVAVVFGLISCNSKEDVPRELEFCFEYLNENWDPGEIEIFKNITKENTTLRDYHFGIGLHLRNFVLRNHECSENLQNYFKNNGVFHFDHMSGLILSTYHQYLNNDRLFLEERFERIRLNMKPIVECNNKRDSLANVYFSEFEFNDTIQILLPVDEEFGAIDYSCNLDWKYNDSLDLKVVGIVLEKHFSDTTHLFGMDMKVLYKSKPDMEVFMVPIMKVIL